MVYASSSSEYEADAHLLKRQHRQNRVLRATDYLNRRITVREVHVAFKTLHMYDYITKLCVKLYKSSKII
jgi:hypothetical protein